MTEYRHSPRRGAYLLLFMAMPIGNALALELDPGYGDGMVLQRGRPIAISGTAAPGEQVTVTLGFDRLGR